jgi:hypothetical protein
LMGDGNLSYERETWKEEKQVPSQLRLHSIDKDFLREFRRACWEQFGIKTQKIRLVEKAGRYHDPNGNGYNRQDCYEIKLGSRVVCIFLSEMQNTDWLNTDEMKLAWIRGIWDSEGCIAKQVLFSNTDEKMVKDYRSILKNILDIETGLHHYPEFKTQFGTTNIWMVKFGVYEDMVKFYHAVRPTIYRKRKKFEQIESKFFSLGFHPWSDNRAPQRRWTEKDISRLKELFDRGFSGPQIAKDMGRTPEAIYPKANRLGLSFSNRT